MTTTLINTNPLGAVDLYVLGHDPRHLEAGESFDVDDDVACELLEQVGNYELAPGQTDPRPAPEEPEPAVAPEPAPEAPAPAAESPALAPETAAPAPEATA